MEKVLCKGNSFLQILFVNGFLYGKGLLEQALCRVVSLWKRHLCKGNSLLKRLFVEWFPYGKGLCKRNFLLEQALFRQVSLWKRPLCKGSSLWKGFFAKLFLDRFLYGKGLFVKAVPVGKGSLQSGFFMGFLVGTGSF